MQEATAQTRALIEQYGPESLPDPAMLVNLPNEIRYGANLLAVQKHFEGPFELDIFFDSATPSTALDCKELVRIGIDTSDNYHIAAALSAGLEASAQAYQARFDQQFKLKEKGYSTQDIEFAQTMTSSMIGGIGYFYGSSIVDRSFAHEYDEDNFAAGSTEERSRSADPQLTESAQLLTATPSRSFFPRGFYW